MSALDKLAGSYHRGLRPHAVYIATIDQQAMIRIGSTADPRQQLRILTRRAGVPVTTDAVLWFRNPEESGLAAATARAWIGAEPSKRPGWHLGNTAAAGEALAAAVAARSLSAATPEALQASIQATVQSVDLSFRELWRTGALKTVNRRYKAMRRRYARSRRVPAAYLGWLFNYRQQLCWEIGNHARKDHRFSFGGASAEVVRELTLLAITQDMVPEPASFEANLRG